VQRQPGESPNDHSDRAIRRAAEWYQVQLGDAVEVLLLTNDVDNKQKAIASGLKAQSIHAYVRSLPEADELQDLLVNTATEAEAGGGGGGGGDGGVRVKKGSARYKAHLPMSELTRGVVRIYIYIYACSHPSYACSNRRARTPDKLSPGRPVGRRRASCTRASCTSTGTTRSRATSACAGYRGTPR
jgi:hypothetical protein